MGAVIRECPICEKSCKTSRGLLQHVRKAHAEAMGHRGRMEYFCWCGVICYSSGGFDDHLARNGGLLRHWWEWKLGLYSTWK